MAVLIKGMEYPQNCGECKLSHNGVCVANIGRKITVDDICPLVQVPTHGRLIDADELKYDYFKVFGDEEMVYRIIDNSPTVIEPS